MTRLIRLTLRWHSEQECPVKSIAQMCRGLDAASKIGDGDELDIDATISIRSAAGRAQGDANNPGNICVIRCCVEIDESGARVVEGSGQGSFSGLIGGHNNISNAGNLDRLMASQPQARGAA